VCDPVGGGSGTDGPRGIDAPVDSACAWQTHFFDACALPMSQGDLHLTSGMSPWNLSTDDATFRGRQGTTLTPATEVLSQPGGNDALVVSVDNFIVDAGASLRVSGSRPLIIAANASIIIDGFIDLSAHHGSHGPGSNPAVCGNSAGTKGVDGTGGAGGGGGGAFQGAGGHGGSGDSDTGPNAGGSGGIASSVPMIVRGGCQGGDGGLGNGGGAPGGAGGGALQLTARASLMISGSGQVNAGGSGGTGGGVLESGGSAGGSGGFLGLEAPVIVFNGTLTANGGGGGAGANDTTAGGAGTNGQLNNLSASGGTNGGNCGTAGGGGSSQSRPAGYDVLGIDTCAGGGGGGGAGYILVFGMIDMTQGLISPTPTLNPF
jgi:hypothetical protein